MSKVVTGLQSNPVTAHEINNKNVKCIDDSTQSILERDVEDVSLRAQNLLDEYYDSKKANDGFNPPHIG